jgi:hypothetical protein
MHAAGAGGLASPPTTAPSSRRRADAVGNVGGRLPSPPLLLSSCSGVFHTANAIWTIVPQRRLVLMDDAQLGTMLGAAERAATGNPAFERQARLLTSQCERWSSLRGQHPVAEAVAAYAALGWLHTPWIAPHLPAGFLDLVAAAHSTASTESGATLSSGKAHLTPRFARFEGPSGATIASTGLANSVSLLAQGAASAAERESVVGRFSLRSHSHTPAAREHVAGTPAPPTPFKPAGDTQCPLAMHAASPFVTNRIDSGTVEALLALKLGLPRAVLQQDLGHVADEAERARLVAKGPMRVVHADLILAQHLRYPCRACAEGWCTIREYALIAGSFTLPFFPGLRRNLFSEAPFTPRPPPTAFVAGAKTLLDKGQAVINNELAAGISRRARPGEQFHNVCRAFAALKLRFAPLATELDQLVRGGGIEGHVRRSLPRLVNDVGSAAGGRPGLVSGRAFAAGILPSVTDMKVRIVHDHRKLNKMLTAWGMSFPTMDEMLAIMTPACWITLIDWLSGFSNQPSDTVNDKYLAYEFNGGVYVKTVSTFGAQNAPPNFCVLSGEVNAVVARRIAATPFLVADEAHSKVHVDDHVATARSKDGCAAVATLIKESIAGTGGTDNSDKELRPSQAQVVHGVRIDTAALSISITDNKRYDYIMLMLLVLELDQLGFFVPVDVFHKVVGRNTYVAAVLHGARLALGPQHEELQAMLERAKRGAPAQQLSAEAKTSLAYFIEELGDKNNGAQRLIISPAAPAATGGISFRADASGDNAKGFGGVLGPVALHGRYSKDCPPIEVFTILARELLSLYFLLTDFGWLLEGLTLGKGTDSNDLLSCLGTGFTRDASCRPILHAVLAKCKEHGILVLTSHFYREDNTVCDDISKADTIDELLTALAPLCGY